MTIILEQQTGKKVVSRTIRNALKSEGLLSCVARKIPLLSKKNIADRLRLGMEWSNWTNKMWEKIIFSDETKINLFSSDGRIKVWLKSKKDFLLRIACPQLNFLVDQLWYGDVCHIKVLAS